MVRASRLSSATIHEAAGKLGALPSQIKPLAPHVRVCGIALPVRCPPGNNLWLHQAIYMAQPGDILVVDTSGAPEFGYWGEVMAVAAMQRGIAGLILNGGVRDSKRLIDMGFPVFSSLVCIQGTAKDPRQSGSIGVPIQLGATVIAHGDLVVGDADGVVVVPLTDADRIIEKSVQRDEQELTILNQLKRGATTFDVYQMAHPDKC
jgi:4-hydroxy-4-methyl-2-oxoglutarate aldolase